MKNKNSERTRRTMGLHSMKDTNSKLLADFVKYATSHPKERFWQALRNWARVDYIYIKDRMLGEDIVDTFYWDTKYGKTNPPTKK